MTKTTTPSKPRAKRKPGEWEQEFVGDPMRFHGGYVIGEALARPDPAALDRDLARRLWEESARLVGL